MSEGALNLDYVFTKFKLLNYNFGKVIRSYLKEIVKKFSLA